MKLRRVLYAAAAFGLLLVKFTVDVISKNVALESPVAVLFRDLVVVGAFVLLFLLLDGIRGRREQPPVRRLAFQLGAVVAVLAAVGIMSIVPTDGFDLKELSYLPLDYPAIFVASLLAIVTGVFSLILLQALRDLILQDRRPGTSRSFTLFLILVLVNAGAGLMLAPRESAVAAAVLYALGILAGAWNAFRLPWIVYLTKREKVFALILSLLLFAGMTLLNVMIRDDAFPGRSLLYYSRPLSEFIHLVTIFGNVYFGTSFISNLFHLPTADAFDRKRTEVTSLGTLSRLIARVLDFNELVDTVTSMTLQVCEAKSCWLELITEPDEKPGLAHRGYQVQVVSVRNITASEIDNLVGGTQPRLRDVVRAERKTIAVDDIAADARFRHLGDGPLARGSMVVVPLQAHDRVVGILYATKAAAYGFVRDDVEVIAAFADQATVAIENSRLIKTSIERERLMREMMLAHEMQQKLLPQEVPQFPSVEIGAVSTPAFEVGGDYYDFMSLDRERLGIIIGDVSGKGVSAAFYMAEVKGVFQALARRYDSPREFMVRANEALLGSIDKHSFVSLLYGILDTRTGMLTLARAGHCPMLLVRHGGSRYLRPGGMGIGLGEGEIFDSAIEEEAVRLGEGDVCVFYTDGVTEARHGADEFGYERLLTVAAEARNGSAEAILHDILGTVRRFTDGQPTHDDLTVVVVKWRGNGRGSDISKREDAA